MLARFKRGILKPLSTDMGDALDVEHTLQRVEAALAGDPGARAFVVEQLACVPAMVRIKHGRMGAQLSVHELEDVVQNVLTAIWKKLGQWDGRAPLEHWAYGFIVFELLKAVERRARRLAVVQVRDFGDPESPVSSAADIDSERLKLVVGRLDPSDQEILRLKHFEDLTFDEIAARTHMPTNTVKTRYYRCIKRLRDSLSRAEEMEA
jgi:RNA polymerase sigma-70 factor (ECF subfamily)